MDWHKNKIHKEKKKKKKKKKKMMMMMMMTMMMKMTKMKKKPGEQCSGGKMSCTRVPVSSLLH